MNYTAPGRYIPGRKEFAMTVEEMKAQAKQEKDTLAKMIFLYQDGKKYTLEQLKAMPLKRLRDLHDRMHL